MSGAARHSAGAAALPRGRDSNKLKSQAAAARQAADRLAGVDMVARCALLGLRPPADDGSVCVRMFGQYLALQPPEFAAFVAADGARAKGAMPAFCSAKASQDECGHAASPADRILALHYLLCERRVEPTGKLITFRDLPGGQFYYEPFRKRTAERLIHHVGNDVGKLARMLSAVEHEPAAGSGLAASVAAIEQVRLTLVYHAGDDEMPPAADILFDSSIRHVYCTEDAAALAARLCMKLMGQCETCCGCGMCDAPAHSS